MGETSSSEQDQTNRAMDGSIVGSFLRCHLLCMESVRPLDSHLAMHIQLQLSGGWSVAIIGYINGY